MGSGTSKVRFVNLRSHKWPMSNHSTLKLDYDGTKRRENPNPKENEELLAWQFYVQVCSRQREGESD